MPLYVFCVLLVICDFLLDSKAGADRGEEALKKTKEHHVVPQTYFYSVWLSSSALLDLVSWLWILCWKSRRAQLSKHTMRCIQDVLVFLLIMKNVLWRTADIISFQWRDFYRWGRNPDFRENGYVSRIIPITFGYITIFYISKTNSWDIAQFISQIMRFCWFLTASYQLNKYFPQFFTDYLIILTIFACVCRLADIKTLYARESQAPAVGNQFVVFRDSKLTYKWTIHAKYFT